MSLPSHQLPVASLVLDVVNALFIKVNAEIPRRKEVVVVGRFRGRPARSFHEPVYAGKKKKKPVVRVQENNIPHGLPSVSAVMCVLIMPTNRENRNHTSRWN